MLILPLKHVPNLCFSLSSSSSILFQATIISFPDFCNSFLTGLPAPIYVPQQSIFYSAIMIYRNTLYMFPIAFKIHLVFLAWLMKLSMTWPLPSSLSSAQSLFLLPTSPYWPLSSLSVPLILASKHLYQWYPFHEMFISCYAYTFNAPPFIFGSWYKCHLFKVFQERLSIVYLFIQLLEQTLKNIEWINKLCLCRWEQWCLKK